MNIIRPAHNIVATKVKSWRSIKKEALELREFMKDIDKKVEGHYKSAYAISHAQVSSNPKDFFVIDESHEELLKLFGSWCIINLKVVKSSEEIHWDEACMSFPFRKPKNTYRMNKVTVKYRVPFLWFTRPVKRKFDGLPAFICQHESDHANGKNIYGK